MMLSIVPPSTRSAAPVVADDWAELTKAPFEDSERSERAAVSICFDASLRFMRKVISTAGGLLMGVRCHMLGSAYQPRQGG
jgi:hypothetical protein